MTSLTEQNKAVVQRFNTEVIVQGNAQSFHALMDERFVNHSAPPGADQGPNGMWQTFEHLLRPAMPDLEVIIHMQVAEHDLVTTRKTILGTHRGPLLGVPPTGQRLRIDVIDMVRIQNGRYLEHCGVNTLASVIQQLTGQ